jgi:hypothetical protein
VKLGAPSCGHAYLRDPSQEEQLRKNHKELHSRTLSESASLAEKRQQDPWFRRLARLYLRLDEHEVASKASLLELTMLLMKQELMSAVQQLS